jgi:hypothetical protein
MTDTSQNLLEGRKTATANRPAGLALGSHIPFPILALLLSLIWPTNLAPTLGTINLPLFRIVFLVLIPFALAEIARNPIRLRAPDFLIIAYSLLQGVSLTIHHGLTNDIVSYYNNQPVTTNALVNSGATFLDTMGAYFLARIYLRTEEQFLATTRLLVFIVIGLGVTTLIESITGFSIFGERTKAFGGSRLGLLRANGPFPHPILWGLFAASAFAFAAMDRAGKPLVITAVTMSLVVIATFTSLSSGAYVMIYVQVMLIAWNILTRGIARRWLVFTSIFVAAYVFIDMLSNRSPIVVLSTVATLDSWTAVYRMLIWRFGWAEFTSSPLTGVGFGDWARPSWMSASIDTFWLAILLRYGLLACLPLWLAIVNAMYKVSRRIDERKSRRLAGPAFAWMASLVSLVIAAFTVHLWGQIYVYFFFLLGMWGVFSRQSAPARGRR